MEQTLLFTGPKCDFVYTGGYSPNPGGPDWYWFINSTYFLQVLYLNFASSEPDNGSGDQTVIALKKHGEWADFSPNPSIHGNAYANTKLCYICEFRL